MQKILLSLVFFCSFVFAYDLNLSANVTALKLDNRSLYIGTDKGEILSFNLEDKNLNTLVTLPKIQNYYEEFAPPIYAIDSFENILAILSESSFGGKDLNLYKNGELKKISLKESGAKEIYLINENTLLIALIGSEIKLYDLKDFKLLKNFKFSHSSLNDISLSEDKKLLVAGFESGEVELFDLQKWLLLENFDSIHKDNIYQVDLKNNTIISCGTDRRVGIVRNKEEHFLQKEFLMYACSLSPSGNLGAFSDNSTNTIEIFDTKTLESIKRFENVNIMGEFIIFSDEKNVIISGFGNLILFRGLDESF